jgi:hypothetical protein
VSVGREGRLPLCTFRPHAASPDTCEQEGVWDQMDALTGSYKC